MNPARAPLSESSMMARKASNTSGPGQNADAGPPETWDPQERDLQERICKKARLGHKLLVEADFNILAPDQGENRFPEHLRLDLANALHCEQFPA